MLDKQLHRKYMKYMLNFYVKPTIFEDLVDMV
jgi:hypothetical protein